MGVAGSILILLGLYLMISGVRAGRPTLGVTGFITFGKRPHRSKELRWALIQNYSGTLTWIGLINSRPEGGYSNDSITLITVPAGLGVLGAVLYILLEKFTLYLIGGKI